MLYIYWALLGILSVVLKLGISMLLLGQHKISLIYGYFTAKLFKEGPEF